MHRVDSEQLIFPERQRDTPGWLQGLRAQRRALLVEALKKPKKSASKKPRRAKVVQSILSMMSHEQLVAAGFIKETDK